jgi:GxxExxY protein
MMADVRDPRTYAVIGAAIDVRRELGHGFLEAVYQEAMGIELALRSIPFVPKASVPVYYKRALLEACYQPDFICFDNVIVELKALTQLSTIESAQVLNYLKATGFDVGLLLNFGSASLEWKRLISSQLRGPSTDFVDDAE